MVCCLIKLIGVISSGGIPIRFKSLIEIKREELIASLVEAVKALSSAIKIGKTEDTKTIEFGEDKLILKESAHGYTVIALADRAEDYVKNLLRIIADDLDSSLGEFPGIVDDALSRQIDDILSTYLSDVITITSIELLLSIMDVWDPIIDSVIVDDTVARKIEETKHRIETTINRYKKLWRDFKSKVKSNRKAAIEYALSCDFDHACACSIDLEDDVAKLFAIRMGLLSASMINTVFPQFSELLNVINSIRTNNIFVDFMRKAIELKLGRITLREYLSIFGDAIKSFEFRGDEESIMLAFLFIDHALSFFPEFAEKLSSYFNDKSPLVSTLINLIVQTDKILEKAYSITKYEDIKIELVNWKRRISDSMFKLERIVRPGFLRRILGLKPRGSHVNRVMLEVSLNLETYLLLLAVLSQSPALTPIERIKILDEILEIYASYLRKLFELDAQIFVPSLVNIFQVLGVAIADRLQILTREERKKELSRILAIVDDLIEILISEYPKMRSDMPPITTFAACIISMLALDDILDWREILLAYLIMKNIDIRAIEEWKKVLPYNFAAITSNLMNMLAPLALLVLKGKEKVGAVKRCVECLIDIWKWMLSQGVVSRGVLIPLSHYILMISDELQPKQFEKMVKTIIGLSRIAVPDLKRNDYEIALMSESLLRLLAKATQILRDDKLKGLADAIYRISLAAWDRYGFSCKAKELKGLVTKIDIGDLG